MFAYCGNNPVVRVDITGYFWKEVWDWTVDIYERNMAIQQQQQALDTQIMLEQINGTKKVLEYAVDFAESLWDTHVLNVKLEIDRQYQQDMAIIDMWEYFSDNPLIAVDTATAVIGLGSTTVGIAATAGIVSIPIAGQVTIGVVGAACSIWGVGRLFVTVWEDLLGGA